MLVVDNVKKNKKNCICFETSVVMFIVNKQ